MQRGRLPRGPLGKRRSGSAPRPSERREEGKPAECPEDTQRRAEDDGLPIGNRLIGELRPLLLMQLREHGRQERWGRRAWLLRVRESDDPEKEQKCERQADNEPRYQNMFATLRDTGKRWQVAHVCSL